MTGVAPHPYIYVAESIDPGVCNSDQISPGALAILLAEKRKEE